MCKYVILWDGQMRTPGIDYKLVGNCEATGEPRFEPFAKIPKETVVTVFVLDHGLVLRRLDLELKSSAPANVPLSMMSAKTAELT